jgi:predicted N-acetyltransferase YhbS
LKNPRIDYRLGNDVPLDAVLAVYRESGLGERRPVDDVLRMEAMLRNATLVVTAWDAGEMIGIARSLSDFSYVTYLSDLAVKRSHQKLGIGRELIRRTRASAGDKTMLVLLAAPAAAEYYPRVGFEHHPRAWIMPGA